METAHHLVEGAAAALVDSIGIVHLPRAIDAQPHQEVVLFEERRPLVVDLRAVSLNRMQDLLIWPAVLLNQFHRAAKEVQSHQRRLTTLPGYVDLRDLVCLQQLFDVQLQQIVSHAKAAAGIEHLLRQEEAVAAIQVANRAGGLGEQMKSGRGVWRQCQQVGGHSRVLSGLELPTFRKSWQL